MLDVLRESQPEQYADIMAQLQASAGGPVGAGVSRRSRCCPSRSAVASGPPRSLAHEPRPLPRQRAHAHAFVSCSLAADAKPPQQGERINPEPSFVIKTATVPTDRGAVRGGTKVFINVTHAAQVPGFRKRRDLSGSEAVEGLHVPIAIGPPRTDVDRAGRPCSVYDVVVNPEVTSGCVSRGGEAFRHMVCGIVMQNVEAKFGRKASPPWTLNEAYRLPTLANRYKGKLPPPAQWVRSPRKAGIETVEGEPGSQAGTAAGGGGGGGAAKPGRAASPGAAAGAMTVAGDAASESVRAAMSVAEAAAAGAPVGPDGVVRVDMQVRRLGEEEEEAKAKGARPMADLQSVAEDASRHEQTETGAAAQAGIAAAERALSAPAAEKRRARAAALIQEVGGGRGEATAAGGADEAVEGQAPAEEGGSVGLRERASRRVRARPTRPPAVPSVAIHLHRADRAATGAGCADGAAASADPAAAPTWWRSPLATTQAEWDRSAWRGIPLPSSAPEAAGGPSGVPPGALVGVTVVLELDPSHPALLQALEQALHEAGKPTSRPHGSAACVAELCCRSHGHEAGADTLGRLLSVACGEESVSVAAPGHTPATVLLPAVVVPARAICEVTARGVDPLALSVRVSIPTAQWPAAVDSGATADPGVPNVHGSGSRATPPRASAADVGRVPDSDTSFPEDRFHVKDPLSLHFLQERERAKAEAEQKQLAKEAAAGPATAAQKAPAPAEYDLESEADLGLL